MKKYLFATTICLLILIAGCSQQAETPTGTTKPFIGGSKGIVAEFQQMGIIENGVDTIYDTDKFPIEISLKNKGEETINPGDVSVALKGISLSDFSGIPLGVLKNKGTIEKISKTNEEGGEEIIDFTPGTDAMYLQKIAGTQYTLNIFAEYTYRYKTRVSVPKVCFKGDPKDIRVCKIEETKESFSSAAPIQVNSVKEKSAGTGLIQLEFNVENIGGGEATKPSAEFDRNYDQISYLLYPESERTKWKCSSAGRENEARFEKGKGATIICKLNNPLSKDDLYEKEIGLEISYDYRDLIQQQLRIKKSE